MFSCSIVPAVADHAHPDAASGPQALAILGLATRLTSTSGGLAGKTHRQLFSEFYQDLMHESLESLLAEGARPPAGVTLFQQMMRDVMSGGQQPDVVAQV